MKTEWNAWQSIMHAYLFAYLTSVKIANVDNCVHIAHVNDKPQQLKQKTVTGQCVI